MRENYPEIMANEEDEDIMVEIREALGRDNSNEESENSEAQSRWSERMRESIDPFNLLDGEESISYDSEWSEVDQMFNELEDDSNEDKELE